MVTSAASKRGLAACEEVAAQEDGIGGSSQDGEELSGLSKAGQTRGFGSWPTAGDRFAVSQASRCNAPAGCIGAGK